jgi:hypothetical protein
MRIFRSEEMADYGTENFSDFILEWRKKLFRKEELIFSIS